MARTIKFGEGSNLIPISSETRILPFKPATNHGGTSVYEGYVHLTDLPGWDVLEALVMLDPHNKHDLPYLGGGLTVKRLSHDRELQYYSPQRDKIENAFEVVMKLEDMHLFYERVKAYKRWGFVSLTSFLNDAMDRGLRAFLRESEGYFLPLLYTRYGAIWTGVSPYNPHEMFVLPEVVDYFKSAYMAWQNECDVPAFEPYFVKSEYLP